MSKIEIIWHVTIHEDDRDDNLVPIEEDIGAAISDLDIIGVQSWGTEVKVIEDAS